MRADHWEWNIFITKNEKNNDQATKLKNKQGKGTKYVNLLMSVFVYQHNYMSNMNADHG